MLNWFSTFIILFLLRASLCGKEFEGFYLNQFEEGVDNQLNIPWFGIIIEQRKFLVLLNKVHLTPIVYYT